MGNVPVTTTTNISKKYCDTHGGASRYKWEAYCDTNGRDTESISFSFELRGSESIAIHNWRCIAMQIGRVLRYLSKVVVVGGF